MKILFKKNFSPDSVELEIKGSDTGKEVRALVAQHEKVEPQEVQLKYWGDVVPDDVKISEYKMKDGDSILYQITKNLKKVKTDGGNAENGTAPKTITLTLKKADGQELKVEAFPEDSIAIIRAKIELAYEIPADALRLKHNNLMMFPAKRLVDYYIQGDVTLDLIVDEKIAASESARSMMLARRETESQKTESTAMEGEVKLKVKFHDGDEKVVNVELDETMEELTKKLLELKPLDQEKEGSYRLKVIIGGEEAKGQSKLKDLGVQIGSTSVATMLERVKKDDELRLIFKRAIGTDTEIKILPKSMTILDVKKQLEAKFNAKVSEINLDVKGAQLADEKKLEECGLEDDAVVTVGVVKKSLFSNK